MPGDTAKTVRPGDTATFTVYVSATRPVNGYITQQPVGWNTTITSTITDQASGARVVKSGDNYQTLAPVRIHTVVPDVDDGDYHIVAVLNQSTDGPEGGTAMQVLQRQTFSYTVTVDEHYVPPQPDTEEKQSTVEQDSQPASGGGGGFISRLQNILNGNDQQDQEDPQDPEQQREEQKQPVDTEDQEPDSKETGPVDPDTGEEETRTGLTGLVSGSTFGVPNKLLLLFELFWGVAITYLIIRRRR